MGTNSKVQKAKVYYNPYSYPFYQSDPSYVIATNSSVYNQSGVAQKFQQNLNSVNKNIFKDIITLNNTGVDRLFDRVNIFTFDFKNLNDGKRYKAIGYKLNPNNKNSGMNTNFISHVCEQPFSSDFVNQTNPISITEITSNILGHESVTTTNVQSIMK
jgi:hypothetical protein